MLPSVVYNSHRHKAFLRSIPSEIWVVLEPLFDDDDLMSNLTEGTDRSSEWKGTINLR